MHKGIPSYLRLRGCIFIVNVVNKKTPHFHHESSFLTCHQAFAQAGSQAEQNANAMFTERGIKEWHGGQAELQPTSCSTATCTQRTPPAEPLPWETPDAFSGGEFLPFGTSQAPLFLPPHVFFNQRDSEMTLFQGKSIWIFYDRFSQSYMWFRTRVRM